ncbi:hypothetical protein QA599_21430 [Haloarculaceae archaeon H-GB1-1]|nr:hypothetical protein [Haloarculaceae archaeon H-GB1-1]
MKRRNFLKTVGGGTAASLTAGAGLLASSGSAAASTVSISAENPATVSNDRGDISQVSADPQFEVQWKNLDDAVAKVFYLIEASVDGGPFVPLFRGTPWLPADVENNSYVKAKSGTTGVYKLKHPHSTVLNQDSRFSDGSGPDESANPLVIADGDGKPAYSTATWSNYGPGDYSSYYETGNSMGTASEAESFLVDDEGLVLQNNYPDINAGYYGAASDTTPFDNDADGTETSTDVTLRYSFELLRPNRSWAESRSGLGGGATKEELAAEIPGIEASDIVDNHSEIVMNGEDGQAQFANPDSVSYAEMRSNYDSHVGLILTTASFQVTANNEPADSGVTGQSNANSE